MAHAISQTFSSVIGSSVTTIAGFIALCFMSFTLGLDIGVVMVKGVILGVLACVTILPSMILCCDKIIEKTKHKLLLSNMDKPSAYRKNFRQGYKEISHLCGTVRSSAIPGYLRK